MVKATKERKENKKTSEYYRLFITKQDHQTQLAAIRQTTLKSIRKPSKPLETLETAPKPQIKSHIPSTFQVEFSTFISKIFLQPIPPKPLKGRPSPPNRPRVESASGARRCRRRSGSLAGSVLVFCFLCFFWYFGVFVFWSFWCFLFWRFYSFLVFLVGS